MIRFRYQPSFADYWLFNRWALMRVFKKILPFAALSLHVWERVERIQVEAATEAGKHAARRRGPRRKTGVR